MIRSSNSRQPIVAVPGVNARQLEPAAEITSLIDHVPADHDRSERRECQNVTSHLRFGALLRQRGGYGLLLNAKPFRFLPLTTSCLVLLAWSSRLVSQLFRVLRGLLCLRG